MTIDTPDPTIGTVLGEEARRAIALKLWGMERAGDFDPEGQAWQRTDAALAVAEPFIASLLSAAREAGAADERERVAKRIEADREGWIRSDDDDGYNAYRWNAMSRCIKTARTPPDA